MDEVETALVEARDGTMASPEVSRSGELAVLGGRGNRDFLLFLRGSLKKVVVVVETVVVVVA